MSSRLGEILVKDSLISADQLKQALDHQKEWRAAGNLSCEAGVGE
jgi:hypothetical protein